MPGALAHDTKVIRHSNAVAAGTSDIEPTNGVDTANYDGVMFLVAFGTITTGAVTSIKAQQSDAIDGSGDAFSDIEGTAIAVADDDDNQIAVLDVQTPTKRYVRCVVDRGTQNAVVDGIIGVLYGGAKPTTHDSTTVVGSELHVSKAEGTA